MPLSLMFDRRDVCRTGEIPCQGEFSKLAVMGLFEKMGMYDGRLKKGDAVPYEKLRVDSVISKDLALTLEKLRCFCAHVD